MSSHRHRGKLAPAKDVEKSEQWNRKFDEENWRASRASESLRDSVAQDAEGARAEEQAPPPRRMSSKKSQGLCCRRRSSSARDPSLGLGLSDPLAGLNKLGSSVADSLRGAGKAIESTTSSVVDGVGAGFRGLSDGLQGMADSAAGALNGGSSSSKA